MDQVIDYEALAEKLLSKASVTGKAAGSTPTATYGHGLGGAFSPFGIEKPVFSALILPQLGLQGMLPAYPSIDTNPLYGIMTGVTANSGSNPTGVCDDPKKVGLMKLCTHSAVFGRWSLGTQVYDVSRVGERINRAEFLDLNLMNNSFRMGFNQAAPTTPRGGDPLNNEFNKAMFEFAVGWGYEYSSVFYTGNPTNNTAGGGYKEPYGLDILINTGYRDAETGVACPAADSIVRSFGNLEVKTNGAALLRQMTNIWRNLNFIASKTRLNPVTWVIAMRWSLFYELTEIWPCAYNTYRCNGTSTFDTAQINVSNNTELTRMRDEMRGDIFARTGQYLLIDGQRVPVVIDDGIAETQVAGASFRSAIYFVPIAVLGGTPVTYWEYFNFDGPNAGREFGANMAPQDSYFTSDGGRFLWHKKPPTNWCVEMITLTKQRIIEMTPFLAARLTGLQYTPVAHERDFLPGASYYVDGGQYARDTTFPSFFSPTA